MESKKIDTAFLYILIIITAVLSGLNYKIFVFPNAFAPSGIDGICTMIQYLTNTNIGYLSLIFNIPLLIVGFAFFHIKRDYILKTGVYILVFSLASILFSYVDLSSFLYYTESGTSIVLAPIVAGVIRGLLYPITLKAGGSSGGIDIIAAMIKYKKPHYNLMNIIFAGNVIVALSAYVVYGFKIEPVVCSIIYAFVTSTVSKFLQGVGKQQVRFEIISEDAERLCSLITEKLDSSATVIDAHGAYSGEAKKLIICVTSKEKTPRLEEILKDFNNAVVFESTITSAMNISNTHIHKI